MQKRSGQRSLLLRPAPIAFLLADPCNLLPDLVLDLPVHLWAVAECEEDFKVDEEGREDESWRDESE